MDAGNRSDPWPRAADGFRELPRWQPGKYLVRTHAFLTMSQIFLADYNYA